MFTGIVQAVGHIVSERREGDGLRIAVSCGALDLSDVRSGDSIAVSGCCLTAVSIEDAALRFDVSTETLRCTTGLDRPRAVNLEKAMRLSDRLGGHLLTGHVDGVGRVIGRTAAGTGAGGVSVEIEAAEELSRFIAQKGSIAVDGASLTVNSVTGNCFSVHLIPHTLAMTTLNELSAGATVNLEVDIIARYLARLQESQKESSWT
jgi:riboflavin synthase